MASGAASPVSAAPRARRLARYPPPRPGVAAPRGAGVRLGNGKENARRLVGNGHLTQCEVLLLLIAALVARLTKQLAVLLLGHTLATLLNN